MSQSAESWGIVQTWRHLAGTHPVRHKSYCGSRQLDDLWPCQSACQTKEPFRYPVLFVKHTQKSASDKWWIILELKLKVDCLSNICDWNVVNVEVLPKRIKGIFFQEGIRSWKEDMRTWLLQFDLWFTALLWLGYSTFMQGLLKNG